MIGTTILLADTSVWVTALRNGSTLLPTMTEERQPIGYTEPVLMELLAGCRSAREESAIERLLARGRLLSFDTGSGFVTAAKVYQQARRNGITPNSFVDCMIITAARNHGATLLTDDANQRRVAQIVGVEVVP